MQHSKLFKKLILFLIPIIVLGMIITITLLTPMLMLSSITDTTLSLFKDKTLINNWQRSIEQFQSQSKISFDTADLLGCVQATGQSDDEAVKTCIGFINTAGEMVFQSKEIRNAGDIFKRLRNSEVMEYKGAVSIDAFNKIERPAIYREITEHNLNVGNPNPTAAERWEFVSERYTAVKKEWNTGSDRVRYELYKEAEMVYPYQLPSGSQRKYGFYITNAGNRDEEGKYTSFRQYEIYSAGGDIPAFSKGTVTEISGDSLTMVVDNGFPLHVRYDGIAPSVDVQKDTAVYAEEVIGTGNGNVTLTIWTEIAGEPHYINPVLFKECSHVDNDYTIPIDPLAPEVTGAIFDMCKALAGRPYHLGTQGDYYFDCSGFVWYVFEKTGTLHWGRMNANQQYYYCTQRPIAEEDTQPGDLIFFRFNDGIFQHVGIYIGGGYFWNCIQSGGVKISTIKGYMLGTKEATGYTFGRLK